MKLTKVMKFYPNSMRADLSVGSQILTINFPDGSTAEISGYEGIESFVNSDAVVCDATDMVVTAEKVLLYFREDSIIAEVKMRGSLCDLRFTTNNNQTLFFTCTMRYTTLHNLSGAVRELMKCFVNNQELFIKVSK